MNPGLTGGKERARGGEGRHDVQRNPRPMDENQKRTAEEGGRWRKQRRREGGKHAMENTHTCKKTKKTRKMEERKQTEMKERTKEHGERKITHASKQHSRAKGKRRRKRNKRHARFSHNKMCALTPPSPSSGSTGGMISKWKGHKGVGSEGSGGLTPRSAACSVPTGTRTLSAGSGPPGIGTKEPEVGGTGAKERALNDSSPLAHREAATSLCVQSGFAFNSGTRDSKNAQAQQ